jgi:outer membrane protein assembly factor BamB
MARTRKLLVLLALALVTSACTTNWATWGGNPERTSFNPNEWQITTANVNGLHQLWAADIGGQISNTAPIVAADIDIDGTKQDLIFVGNEHGGFYAVSETGRVVWSRQLGANTQPDCLSTPDGVHGVAGAALFDKNTNRVYVADGDGQAYALDARTGATIPGWPVEFAADGLHDIVESAPTLVNNHLYIETASYCDIIPYRGRIVDINPTTATIAHTWFTAGATGPYAGGIWGWGGVSVDRTNGDVYVATGNVGAVPENVPYGDAVVRLSANLQVKAAHSPTPLIGDDDFGSTPLLFQQEGCPPQLVTMQKNGSVYLYDRDNIAAGFRQRIEFGQPNLIGVAAYSPVTKYVYIMNNKGSANAQYVTGIAAFRTNASCNLELVWQTPVTVSVAVTPTIANGIVYFSSGNVINTAKVYAVNAETGQILWSSPTIPAKAYATPAVVNGRVYVAAYDGKLRAYGL